MKQKDRQKTKQKIIEIDASGKVLGRLATEVVTILRGKDKPSFVPYKEPGVSIYVYNLGKIKVTGKKPEQKTYWHYSGYPGGIKGRSYKDVFSGDPTEVFRKAIWGMLPKNKLRARMMKRLRLYAGEIKT